MMLMLQSGCASGLRGSFCDIYHPVYTAPKDTAETKRQVDGNNAVWLALCAEKLSRSVLRKPTAYAVRDVP